MTIRWVAAAGSDVGRMRQGNEDTYRIDEDLGIFLVADGMGGHAAGDVASRLAADSSLEALSASSGEDFDLRFRSAFGAAHQKICNCCEDDPATAGMGTTLTIAVVGPDGDLHVGHIGDSRLYRVRDGELQQITRDHTWVQREVDEGRLRPDRAHSHPLSHILTRVLSDTEPPTPDVVHSRVESGDFLLLCTDGLHTMLEDDEILDCVLEGDSAADIVDLLIDSANDAGGLDNVTVVALQMEDRGA